MRNKSKIIYCPYCRESESDLNRTLFLIRYGICVDCYKKYRKKYFPEIIDLIKNKIEKDSGKI